MVRRSSLYVEGTDDTHVIKHLLKRHGIECPFDDEVVADTLPAIVPEIKRAGNKDQVLEAIESAVKFGTGHSVGFVLDADEVVANSWRAVCGRLSFLRPKPPTALPTTGFVADVPDYRSRVGVWLMPDNQTSGALEEFLKELVDDSDALLPFAYEATDTAKRHRATFPNNKREKAVLRAWLAWQKEPGLPFGTAIAAKYFTVDSPTALALLRWFDELFGTQAVAGRQ